MRIGPLEQIRTQTLPRFGGGGDASVAAPEIAITNGRGVAGSTYTVTNGGTGNWQADGSDIAGETGSTYVLSLVNEGRAIRWRRSDGAASNIIEMWVPQTDFPSMLLVFDIRQGRNPTSGATQTWTSLAGSNRTGTQNTAANQPTYTATALGAGIPGFTTDGTDFFDGISVGATSTSRFVLALARFDNTGSNRTVIGGTATNDFGFRRDGNGRMQAILSGLAALATDTTVVANNAVTMVGVSITQNSAFEFSQNGRVTTTGTASNGTFPANNTMQLFAALAGQITQGANSSVLFADATGSPENRQKAQGWLSATTGGPIDSSHPFATLAPRVQ